MLSLKVLGKAISNIQYQRDHFNTFYFLLRLFSRSVSRPGRTCSQPKTRPSLQYNQPDQYNIQFTTHSFILTIQSLSDQEGHSDHNSPPLTLSGYYTDMKRTQNSTRKNVLYEQNLFHHICHNYSDHPDMNTTLFSFRPVAAGFLVT